VAMIGLAALSIDVGTLYQASTEAQRAADAAALAAARVISLSGITGDPANLSGSWQKICGGANPPAAQAASAVAGQNPIGGLSVPNASITVKVTYSTAVTPAGSADCSSGLDPTFATNPIVTVYVQRKGLPTSFARIWGQTGSSVSATASAEAFNPSGSDPVTPVSPRCVKPWIVPNIDPTGAGGTCTGNCMQFVNNGSIVNGGIAASGIGVIGETFTLVADCNPKPPGSACTLVEPPKANGSLGTGARLDYVPGQVLNPSIAIASGAVSACSDVTVNPYTEAVAGCDQSTVYQCGVTNGNIVDLSENPGPLRNDSVNGAQCLINANASGTVNSGQDVLVQNAYPFQIQAGSNSALLLTTGTTGIAQNSEITSSPSIVSLPIYDNSATLIGPATSQVTIIGFLQVFINWVDGTTNVGEINVTVMNVAACGSTTNPAVTGTSPVPIRLITTP